MNGCNIQLDPDYGPYGAEGTFDGELSIVPSGCGPITVDNEVCKRSIFPQVGLPVTMVNQGYNARVTASIQEAVRFEETGVGLCTPGERYGNLNAIWLLEGKVSWSGQSVGVYADPFVGGGPGISLETAAISPTSATIKAEFTLFGQETSWEVQYGTTQSYGSYQYGGSIPKGSADPVKREVTLTGLQPNTTYHYRVGQSEDKTFKTASCKAENCVWSTQTTPNPALPPNPVNKAQLEAVSCPSTSLCLATGTNENAEGGFGQRWNGSEWKADTYLKELPSKSLGIACPSTASCLTVGYKKGNGSYVATAERWTPLGEFSWITETLTVPAPAGGGYVKLKDVSCTSESACTAVGSYDKENKSWTLAERWNGTSWSIQTTANPASGGAELLGVSCDGASSCTAVGQKGSSKETFIERWNGTSWSISTSPNPSPSIENTLQDVSCTSASNCLAVGGYRESGSGVGYRKKTLTERWNGTSWSIVSSPNPAVHYGAELLDVSCTSSAHCTAVGGYATATWEEIFATEEKTLVESWNGASWSIQTSPNPEGKKLARMLGVSCVSSTYCKGVGSGVQGDTTTLAEGYE
jgi:hypothetical protein